jgi:hypothetical protein
MQLQLTIDADRYLLPAGTRVSQLKKRLLNAARGGGGFLRLISANHPTAEVMVTEHSRVRIEYLDDEESTAPKSSVEACSIDEFEMDLDIW